jgi:hypothetical protein
MYAQPGALSTVDRKDLNTALKTRPEAMAFSLLPLLATPIPDAPVVDPASYLDGTAGSDVFITMQAPSLLSVLVNSVHQPVVACGYVPFEQLHTGRVNDQGALPGEDVPQLPGASDLAPDVIMPKQQPMCPVSITFHLSAHPLPVGLKLYGTSAPLADVNAPLPCKPPVWYPTAQSLTVGVVGSGLLCMPCMCQVAHPLLHSNSKAAAIKEEGQDPEVLELYMMAAMQDDNNDDACEDSISFCA